MAKKSIRIITSKSDKSTIRVIDSDGNDWAKTAEVVSINILPLVPGETPMAEIVVLNPQLELED